MINLLSDEVKNEIRAARTNVIIVRYMAIIFLAFAFIGGSLYLSYSVLETTMHSANDLIATNDVKADVYSETKNQVDTLSSKLNEAKAVLDSEVQYSQILVKIGQQMPAGTVLGELTLDSKSFSGTPVNVQVYAKSMTEATQLQSKFQASNVFGQVSIQSTNEKGGIDGYPVSVQLTAVLNKAGVQ